MCGIAGIIHFDGKPVVQSDLKKMTDSLAHRGPDGEGFFIDGAIGFGHRRLAIVDLSATGSQPMNRFGLTITYNGEIYNYVELRAELAKLGYAFLSTSDTEVILAAYHAWGSNCVQRFNGMWAFAIYDTQRQEVFLSRDRFGEKPFYYAEKAGRLVFGSEIRALLAVGVLPKLNQPRLIHFLVNEEVGSNCDSFFEGVWPLRPGHTMTIALHTGAKTVSAFYDWSSYTVESSQPLEKRLQQAVQLRMRADVPVGICLSGGIDSSLLAVQMQQLTKSSDRQQEMPISVTASLPGDKADEATWAQQVVNYLHLQGKTVDASKVDWWALFQQVVRIQEEPFDSPSVCMQQLVMQKAATCGLRVMLDGQGADELWLGYKRYLPLWMRHATNACAKPMQLAKLLHRSNTSLVEMGGLWMYHTRFLRRWQRRVLRWQAWLQPGFLPSAPSAMLIAQRDAWQHSLNHVRSFELGWGSLPALLRYEDKNAMACSVETRLPYLDADLAALAMQMPLGYLWKDGWTKQPLRATLANAGLPAVAWRKGKIGFEPPREAWLYQTAMQQQCLADSDVVAQIVKPGVLATLPPAAIWRLTVVAEWAKQFGVVM